MPAVWLRFRSDLRSRRGAWLVLGILIGLIASVVLAALADARRTEVAYPQLVAATKQADVLVWDSTPNPQIPLLAGPAVEALPQVAAAGHLRAFDTLGSLGLANGFNALGSPAGDAFMPAGGINQAQVIAGRSFRPDTVDEAMVDFGLAERFHLHAGSTFTARFPRPTAGMPSIPDEAAGVVPLTFRVVGIVATPGQFPPESGFYFSGPALYVTPTFLRAHTEDLSSYDANVISLKNGAADLPPFLAALAKIANGSEPVTEPLGEHANQVRRDFHLQVVALWLLGGLLGLAAFIIMIELLVRQAGLESRDWPTLWAMGMGRGDLVVLGALRTAFVGSVAAVVAVAGAVGLSRFTPIGTAARAEIHPGIAFDAPVLLLGAFGLLALALAISALPLARAASHAAATGGRTAGEARTQPPSRVVQGVSRSGLPVTATTGVRLALEAGRGPTSVPVRSTIAGGLVGIAALVAALTFGASLDHLLRTPRLYGVSWDAEVTNNNGPEAVAKGIDTIRADPDVAGEAWVSGGSGSLGGIDNIDMQVLDPLAGTIRPVIVSGREPAAADEIALGEATRRRLGVEIGGVVQASAAGQGGPTFPVHVVGRAVLEPTTATGELGIGAVITPAGLNRLLAGAQPIPPFTIAVKFRSGLVTSAAANELSDRLQAQDSNFGVSPPIEPSSLVSFGQVSFLPFALGGLLGLVALLVLLHLLLTSVRRRQRDLAILKALGFTRGQVRGAVLWQATTLSAVVLAIGVPLGIAAGRWVWNLLAIQYGILPEPATPLLLILGAVAAIVVLAVLASLVPAVLAGRTRPALVLRSE